jgi:hypothetical protein
MENNNKKSNKVNMSVRPPVPPSVDDFIQAAERKPEPLNPKIEAEPAPPKAASKAPKQNPPKTRAVHAWDSPNVRHDVIKAVNLRLSEPYILKLQYISTLTRKSQQEIIRDILLPALDAEIEKLTNN